MELVDSSRSWSLSEKRHEFNDCSSRALCIYLYPAIAGVSDKSTNPQRVGVVKRVIAEADSLNPAPDSDEAPRQIYIHVRHQRTTILHAYVYYTITRRNFLAFSTTQRRLGRSPLREWWEKPQKNEKRV